MNEIPTIPPGLGWRRLLARLVLWFERLLPALFPAARVVGLFLCVALLDLLPILPWWAHGGLLAVTAGAIVVLLWHGLTRLYAAGFDRRRPQAGAGLRTDASASGGADGPARH